jgi:predicted CxxxxCH...CXXCH cytochrome family protein
MRTKIIWLTLLALVAALPACGDDWFEDGDPYDDDDFKCNYCHGSAENPAPPNAVTDGQDETSFVGVGAHQIHVTGGAVYPALDCAVCHPTPDADDPLSHVGPLPAEITFGGVALLGGLTPEWNRAEATCANVYCHGAGLAIGGGAYPAPSWTFADGAHPGNCGGCHGAPPPAPHPQDAACAACHPGTVAADGTIDLAGGLHINGTVDMEISSCSACHGFPPAAPHPQDTACHLCHGGTVSPDGSIDADGGLHQDGAIQWAAGAGSCDKCHGAPPAAPHVQDDGCAACHAGSVDEDGAIVGGGSHYDGDVQWAPTLASCGKCHGFPPAPPHTTDTACWTCHAGTVKDDGTIDGDGGLHMNGDVDVAGGPDSCNICHGDPPAAPHPPATSHTQCSWCHSATVQPNGTIDEASGTHQNGSVETNKLHPEEFSDPTIHGHHFNNDGPSGCTICHGEDLKGGPTGTSCDKCHPSFRTNCTFCHGGTDNDTGAPPESHLGETDTSFAGVGAHTIHLAENPFWHKSYQCSECHATYTDAMDPGHINGIAALSWGEIAGEEDATPVYEDGTCSGVYCHGGALKNGNGALTAPVWTQVDGTQAACGNCHSLPPGGGHPPMNDCSMCHGCVATSEPAIRPEGAAFHINGEVNMEPVGNCPTGDE